MNALSLEGINARLDGALGSLSCGSLWGGVGGERGGAATPKARDLNWMGFKVPSNPSHSLVL